MKKTNESKDIFINNIAHELRTPLTLIKGPIDMILKKSMKKDIVQRMLESIQFNSNKLSSLVDDLVQISLLEKDARKANPELFNLYKFMCDIISSMEFIALENWVRIKLKYNIDKELYYKIDKNFLEKIFTNLLSNAMKFTRDESEILVIVDEENNELYIRVKDQGSGVKKVDRKKIFQRYYQTDTSSKKQGLGIGLNYSLSLAKRMGGDLVLENSSSYGSVFLLHVPVMGTKPRIKKYKITNKVKEDKKAITDTLKVLIVEDNIELQTFLENVLKEHYSLYKANNGIEALKLLESIKLEDLPDIIISDIMMSKMDGIELLKLIRAHPFLYNIPVIILSAKTDIKDKFEAFQIGIDDYITKPFNTDELLLRLNNTGKRIRKRKLYISQRNFDSKLTDRDIGWLTSLQKCVVKNILNKQLNVNFIADELDVSRMQLSRKTKELLGITPKEYLKEIKLHYIREELNKGKSINQISKVLGYSKASYIKKSYWERFGIEL